ncbi:MAG TPA: type IV pilin-like G/H family protein, partial [Nostoc sp.]|uniref:type IV pilin-like G/H family protein n=1 Tax=Nostoc sp. TaxID=1180 RepID=UPI002D6679C4
LQHILNKKNENEGFTLIELLVVIIIIGILSAIALPSFLNQAAKAKQSEAKTYVGSVNRAQQSYRIENVSFAGTVDELQIGIPTSTVSYTYTISPTTPTSESTTFNAAANDAKSLKSFAGGVIILASGQTSAAACQTTGVTSSPPAVGLSTTAGATCASALETMK